MTKIFEGAFNRHSRMLVADGMTADQSAYAMKMSQYSAAKEAE